VVTTVGMYYDVIPEKAPLFLAKFKEVIELLRGVPGHRESFLYQLVDDPSSFAILSDWDDPDAFQTFIRSEMFRQVTTWGREEVLRNRPRHKVYTRAEDPGPPHA
jgi:heme-degrading monooxygenase HmoA